MIGKIPAVAERDLEKLLESLRLLGDLDKNSLLCAICGKSLSLESIGCIYPSEREIKVCCDDLKCLQKAIDEITPMRGIRTKGGNEDES